MRLSSCFVTAVLVAASLDARATVFATVHGVVHDPQHRPVAGAHVVLNAVNSQYSQHTETDGTGEFDLPQTPLGRYTLAVSSPGFETFSEPVGVASGTNPVVHIALNLAAAQQTVQVKGL